MPQTAIQVDNLTKTYRSPSEKIRRMFNLTPRDPVTAVNQLNLTVEEGEIFGLVGRNGQGKTTLIKCISALIEPTEGDVKIFGYVNDLKNILARQQIGLVTADERSFYWRLSGRQNLLFFSRLHGVSDNITQQKIAKFVEDFGLQKLIDLPFRVYSTGNRQKLAIVRALIPNPKILLMDEPTRSLDPLAARDLRNLFRDHLNKELGITIFLTSHQLEEVQELCQRVAILKAGQIVECATLEKLREKYSREETVTVIFQSENTGNIETALNQDLTNINLSQNSNQDYELTFKREVEDMLLDKAIQILKDQQARIISIQSSRPGLKEIMEIIEEQAES